MSEDNTENTIPPPTCVNPNHGPRFGPWLTFLERRKGQQLFLAGGYVGLAIFETNCDHPKVGELSKLGEVSIATSLKKSQPADIN